MRNAGAANDSDVLSIRTQCHEIERGNGRANQRKRPPHEAAFPHIFKLLRRHGLVRLRRQGGSGRGGGLVQNPVMDGKQRQL